MYDRASGSAAFDPEIKPGVELFNSEQFYECHDFIEDIWLQESSDQQPFLQGLIQAAVAFYHFQNGSLGAARSMLALALAKLEPYPDGYRGIRVAPLVAELGIWKEALDEAVATSNSRIDLTLPRIQPAV